MPIDMQAKLLRVLEAKEFERVGGNKKIRLDVRILAATNENIEEEIKKGRFREDLYYRLNVIPIEIPSLRERKEDIEILAEEILHNLLEEMKLGEKKLSSKTIRVLQSYAWPGNVRELRNVIERAINLSTSTYILPEHLPERLVKISRDISTSLEDIPILKEAVAQAEISSIVKALEITGGNKSLAARKLGIHRTALYKKLEQYNIKDNLE